MLVVRTISGPHVFLHVCTQFPLIVSSCNLLILLLLLIFTTVKINICRVNLQDSI